MKKKIIFLLALCLLFVFGLASCDSSSNENNTDTNSNNINPSTNNEGSTDNTDSSETSESTETEEQPVDEKEITRQTKETEVNNYLSSIDKNYTFTTSTYVLKINDGVVEKNGIVYEKNLDGDYDVFTPHDDNSYIKTTISKDEFTEEIGDDLDLFVGARIILYNYDTETVYIKLSDGNNVATSISDGELTLRGTKNYVVSVKDVGKTTISDHTNIYVEPDPIIPVDVVYAIKDGNINVKVVKEVLTDWLLETNFVYLATGGNLEEIKLINIEDNILRFYYISIRNDTNRTYFGYSYLTVDEVNNVFANKIETTKETFVGILSGVSGKKFKTAILMEFDATVSQEDSIARTKALIDVDASFAFETAGVDNTGKWGWKTVAYGNGKLYTFGVVTKNLSKSKEGASASNCNILNLTTTDFVVDNSELFIDNNDTSSI